MEETEDWQWAREICGLLFSVHCHKFLFIFFSLSISVCLSGFARINFHSVFLCFFLFFLFSLRNYESVCRWSCCCYCCCSFALSPLFLRSLTFTQQQQQQEEKRKKVPKLFTHTHTNLLERNHQIKNTFCILHSSFKLCFFSFSLCLSCTVCVHAKSKLFYFFFFLS